MFKKFHSMIGLGRNVLIYFFFYIANYFEIPGMKHLASVRLIMKDF